MSITKLKVLTKRPARPGFWQTKFVMQSKSSHEGRQLVTTIYQQNLDSEVFVSVFCNLCNKIVDTGEWPEDWRRSVFITIAKVKGTARCDEHRTIALISHASKILLRILLNRMQKVAEEHIADVQMGFRKGVGTRDQIFNLRIIMEKARESSVPL